MNLSVGIVGLPNVGKSTLFNALLGRQIANTENYPFCTIEPNVGIVEVPDGNLLKLEEVVKSGKIVPAVVKFIDIAGLVKGAAEGGGLGNKFLAHVRECSVICHVLRDFTDSNVAKAGAVSPEEDYETVKTELILRDLETLERSLGKFRGTLSKEEKVSKACMEKLKDGLNRGKLASEVGLSDAEQAIITSLSLLTSKPFLFVLNVNDEDIDKGNSQIGVTLLKGLPLFKPDNTVTICAKLEQELTDLPLPERKEYLLSLGLEKSALEQLISLAYQTLGLISFYTTTGSKEVRAWTIKKGTLAPQAAGVIHTDFEKGFIKAAAVSLEDFVAYGGWAGARGKGKARFEGRGYAIQPNEVVEFSHH